MEIVLAVVFEEYGLSGDEIDYYSVDNSFLDRVAENRKGAFHLPSVLDGPLHLVANIASIIFMLSYKPGIPLSLSILAYKCARR